MFKQLLYDTYTKCWIDAFQRKRGTAPVVLFYHGVEERPHPIIETESIAVSDFTQHLKYLRKHYNVITPIEFEQRFNENDWDGKEVLLTFDDGYQNIHSTALPILEQFAFPFLLFATTNNISNNSLFPTTISRLVVLASSLKRLTLDTLQLDVVLTDDTRVQVAHKVSMLLKTLPFNDVNNLVAELVGLITEDEFQSLREKYSSVNPMSWDELKKVSESQLCTVGSHALDHICCHTRQSESDLSRQIINSRLVLQEKLGITCDYFAYPNGNYTEMSNEVVKSAGYKLGFSTKRLPVNSLTRWNVPRLYVPYDYSRFVYSIVNYPR